MIKSTGLFLMFLLASPALLPGQTEKLAPVPKEPGLYYRAPDNLVPIEGQVVSTVRAGNLLASAATFGIKSIKLNEQIPGEKSAHTTSALPTFYYRAPSEADAAGGSAGDLVLVRLEVKHGRREFVVAEGGAFGGSTGIAIRAQIQLVRKRMLADLYQLVPAQNLKPGEYAFFMFRGFDLPGYIYDFTVR